MTRPPRSPVVSLTKKPYTNDLNKRHDASSSGGHGVGVNETNPSPNEYTQLLEVPVGQQIINTTTTTTNKQGGTRTKSPPHHRSTHSASSFSSLDSGYSTNSLTSYYESGGTGTDDFPRDVQLYKLRNNPSSNNQYENFAPPEDLKGGAFLNAKNKATATTTATVNATATTSTRSLSLSSWIRSVPRADPGAFQFAFRMGLLLMISGLFVLIQTPEWQWPDGMWVLISVLFVCWFPALDAASVVEKIFQRLIGTFVGAFMGLACGFLSLFLFPHTRNYQVVFLSICMFVGNFFIIFYAGQSKVGGVKVIRKYAYATILCVLTFCICMLPFGCHKNPKWLGGVFRIVNVILGCLLGALGAIAVCPKSTSAVLHDKTARQVKLCGEASEAVLVMAADHFAGKVTVQDLAMELANTPLESTVRWSLRRVNSGYISEDSTRRKICENADVALQKYEDAMDDWKASKMLFPLTKFDPFQMKIHEEHYASKTALNQAIARTLARSMRIQTTIVMLDGMVRHDTDYNLARNDLRLLRRIGLRIKALLSVPLDDSASKSAALELLNDLKKIRRRILLLSHPVSAPDDLYRSEMEQKFRASLLSGDDDCDDDDVGRGIPKFASDANENARFFLQLVEHLILRSLRLYQAWKQVLAQASKVKDKTIQSWVKSERNQLDSNNDPTVQNKPGDSLRSLIGF